MCAPGGAHVPLRVVAELAEAVVISPRVVREARTVRPSVACSSGMTVLLAFAPLRLAAAGVVSSTASTNGVGLYSCCAGA